ECLTGEVAVSGASVQEVLMKQLGGEPVPIPPWLRRQRLGRLLETVTAKQVERRDASVEGLLQGLELIEAGDRPRAEPLPEGERRQLTVVSCRLTVSPLDGESRDEPASDFERVDQLLHAEHATIAELAGRDGGRIASVMADRALLVFGYPQASEHDARRAASTALRIADEVERHAPRVASERRHRLAVRIGIHTGLVIAREMRGGSRQELLD